MLCVLVFYIHSYNLEVYGLTQWDNKFELVIIGVENYVFALAQIAVPGFFMISGFLFFRNFHLSELIGKWKRRIRTILIPYFVWCSIYYLYCVGYTNLPIINRIVHSSQIDFSVVEWIKWLWPNSYYTLWFLKALIILIVLTPVEWLVLKNHWQKIPTGLIVLVIIWLWSYDNTVSNPFPEGLPYYAVGAYIGLNHSSVVYKKTNWLSIIAILFVILQFATDFYYYNNLGKALIVVAIWLGMDMLPRDVKSKKWMRWTFFYYVAHDMVLEVIEKIWYLVLGNTNMGAFTDFIIAPLVTLGILVFVSSILSKRLPKTWKILTGR